MNHRQKLRKRVILWEAQQGKCWICQQPLPEPAVCMDGKVPPDFATIDHIVPLSKGGKKSDTGNMMLAHQKCNLERGSPRSAG